jgi:hypothetical protein
MPEVREERSGWRDMRLSDRHRRWGWDCPAVDLDFLFLEYDRGLPVAIVEYKHERALPVSLGHPTYHAIRALADMANIPFLVCRYKDDFSKWKVTPANEQAKKHLPVEKVFYEDGWVSFLYRLRGYQCPQTIIDGLKITV